MPRSNRGSADANSIYPSNARGRMPSPSSPPRGLALATAGPLTKSSILNREHSSLPGTDIYANLIGQATDLHEFLHKHLGDKGSMIAAYNNSSQQRKQYYEEQFQYKDNAQGAIRERVQRDSPVVAELRTNVIIKDEFTLVIDLSYHLAARYTRPESAIMVRVDHSACLAMGGTFDPCYILAITAAPTQMGPAMNKRNAALIQSFMADILSVPADRGIVKFLPIPEENFATNGTTISGEIEKQEKQRSGANDSTMRRAITSTGRKSVPSFKKSVSRLDNEAKIGGLQISTNADSRNTAGKGSGGTSHSRETTAPAALSPTGLFELPANDADKKRPATAHAHAASTGSDGLRMNGVSSKSFSLRNPGTPKSRPQTVSGTSVQQQMASAPPPPAVRLISPPSSRRDGPPSFLKIDPSRFPRQRQRSPTDPRSRPRDSPVEAIIDRSAAGNDDGDKKAAAQAHEEEDKPDRKNAAANTAKRRSTATATPHIPDPPPTPSVYGDKKCTKSTRIGKRKSFLSAFRRSTGSEHKYIEARAHAAGLNVIR